MSYRLRSTALPDPLMLLSILTGILTVPVIAQEKVPHDDLKNSVVFAEHFLPRTMRVDYFHSGNATQQHVALDSVVSDGPWAGTRRQLIDPLGWGEYSFEVRDQGTDRLLYSRGFCSVFGEWQTTAPAKQRWGTFHESLRFPWPKGLVRVVLKQRMEGQWQDVWSTSIDPQSRFVTDAQTPRRDTVWTVFEHGDPAEKVDIVLLGDGFTSEEMPLFHKVARQLTASLFATEPFKNRRHDFNVRAIDVAASQSGISQPREKIFRRSPLGCEYNTFDLSRYVLTFRNKAVRDAAAQAPYDCLVILLNEKRYGGGGIYNDQTIVAAHNGLSGYVLIHEFGHHLAGLADEYYAPNVAYETGKPITIEPWEPNVTALLDGLPPKWKDLIEPNIPIPTPWNKEAFESRGKKRAKDRQEGQDSGKDAVQATPKSSKELLAENEFFGKVGAFEGARYETKGLYRPAINCAMFSRSTFEFCPVCRRAIQQVIDMHIQ